VNESSPFNPIMLNLFDVSNKFLNRYWSGNVSNGWNNSNASMKRVRHTTKKKLLNTTVIWGIKWRFWLPYFARMAGTGTAIYPATTMNNMAVLDETPQHPLLNALRK